MNLLKKFIKYYLPYRFVFFMDLLCASIISIIDILYPLILNYCTHTIFIEKQTILSILPKLAIGLILLYSFRALCRYYVSCQGHIMGAEMERDMRQELFDQYQRLSFSYYDQNNTGVMMSRITSDLWDISEFAHHGPENLFISFVKIIGSFCILSFIYYPLALLLLIITCCMFVFSYSLNQKMRRTFDDNRKKIGNVNASVQDSLAGIRIVKAFTNESIEKDKFKEANEKFLISKRDNYKAMGEFSSGNNFFQGILYVAVIVGGGYFVAKGNLNVFELTTFVLYVNVFVQPIEILVELMEMMQKGLSGFRRFDEVMQVIPDIQDQEGAMTLDDVKGTIEFKNVFFQYNENETVLKNVNLKVDAAKKLALVGPSGAGKTTLCSLIPRFYDVQSGEVLIDGVNVKECTLHSLRSSIGLVQQDVYLFSGSIYQNIAYGKKDATREEIIEAAKKANIHDFIMSLPNQYDTYVGERGARLSGGQKQRISIARMFLKNPPIIILDEATSALDNESEKIIQKSLEKLSEGRTCITIAHRLSTIRNADEIVVVSEDGITEKGSHSELMELDGIYARYYRMQFEKDERSVF